MLCVTLGLLYALAGVCPFQLPALSREQAPDWWGEAVKLADAGPLAELLVDACAQGHARVLGEFPEGASDRALRPDPAAGTYSLVLPPLLEAAGLDWGFTGEVLVFRPRDVPAFRAAEERSGAAPTVAVQWHEVFPGLVITAGPYVGPVSWLLDALSGAAAGLEPPGPPRGNPPRRGWTASAELGSVTCFARLADTAEPVFHEALGLGLSAGLRSAGGARRVVTRSPAFCALQAWQAWEQIGWEPGKLLPVEAAGDPRTLDGKLHERLFLEALKVLPAGDFERLRNSPLEPPMRPATPYSPGYKWRVDVQLPDLTWTGRLVFVFRAHRALTRELEPPEKDAIEKGLLTEADIRPDPAQIPEGRLALVLPVEVRGPEERIGREPALRTEVPTTTGRVTAF